MKDEKMICDKEKAAREYAKKGMSLYMDSSDEQDIYMEDVVMGFLAGAKFMQSLSDKRIEELEGALKQLCKVLDPLDDTNSKEHYVNIAIAYGAAKKLLEE